MNVSDLKTLISDLQATTISHLEIDSEGLKVKIDWNRSGAPQVSARGLTVVRAPIAGTFNRTGGGDKPLVEVGDTVTAGQVLCVIDVGGQLNEIESEVAGEVAMIHISNGGRVEINTPLFEIRAKG
jgi:biotin carboxyl carrier protein